MEGEVLNNRSVRSIMPYAGLGHGRWWKAEGQWPLGMTQAVEEIDNPRTNHAYLHITATTVVNASSKNGTLVTHPTLHPPEMGIGSKCVSEDFQELSFSNFQAFLQRGCTSFNPFLLTIPHI